ncbi:MAG: MFS transporter, partial [Gaiellaceae bacterium]
ADLLDAAREAFAQGLQLAAVTSAVLAVATAIVAAVLLRHVGGGSGPGADEKSLAGVAAEQRQGPAPDATAS